MKTYTSHTEALTQSITHNEIACLVAPDLAEMLDRIDSDPEVREMDWVLENTGSIDCWGERAGRGFRVRILTATTPELAGLV